MTFASRSPIHDGPGCRPSQAILNPVRLSRARYDARFGPAGTPRACIGPRLRRERQYEHIKQGLLEGGNSEEKAEEIAARTVNKERARSGEAKEASPTSIETGS